MKGTPIAKGRNHKDREETRLEKLDVVSEKMRSKERSKDVIRAEESREEGG